MAGRSDNIFQIPPASSLAPVPVVARRLGELVAAGGRALLYILYKGREKQRLGQRQASSNMLGYEAVVGRRQRLTLTPPLLPTTDRSGSFRSAKLWGVVQSGTPRSPCDLTSFQCTRMWIVAVFAVALGLRLNSLGNLHWM